MNRAVFLDRDNTLIDTAGDLGDPARVALMEGVAEGLRELRKHGFRLIVTTNQPGVAQGLYTEDDVDAVHQRIAELVDEHAQASNLIDRFYYCPFHPDGNDETYRREHPWRIPNPGMILQAAHDLDIDLSESWMIGDQPGDIAAGRAAGCRTVLVTRDAGLVEQARPMMAAERFADAVSLILGSEAGQADHRAANGHGTAVVSPKAGTRESIESPSSGAMDHAPSGAPDPGHSNHGQPQEARHRRDGARATGPTSGTLDQTEALQRTCNELLEELRAERIRRAEFTVAKMAAGICQMLVILFVLLALLQLENLSIFSKWMAIAGLGQLVVMSLLLLDARS